MNQCHCGSCQTVRQAREYSAHERPTSTKTKSGRQLVPARGRTASDSMQRFFALFGISTYYPSALDLAREWLHRRSPKRAYNEDQ